MAELRRLPTNSDTDAAARPYHLLTLDGLAAWPKTLPFDSEFSLFLAGDRNVKLDSGWDVFAGPAIRQGLRYFCAWGPYCERLHDLMDEEIVGIEVDENVTLPHVMTTWHEDQELEEALAFFRDHAGTIDGVCLPGIVILVGRPDLVARVEEFPFG